MIAGVVPMMGVDAVALMEQQMVLAEMPPLMEVPLIVVAAVAGQIVVALMALLMLVDVMPPLMVVPLMSSYVPRRTSCAGDDQVSSSFP